MAKSVVVVDGVRTPFGRLSGALSPFSPTELGVFAAKGVIEKVGLDPKEIDQCFFGCVLQPSLDSHYTARHIGLKSGLPIEVPALTLNRLCGSGLEAIIQGARAILEGTARVTLCGGAESMTNCPHVIYGLRDGLRLGDGKLQDMLWDSFNDPYVGYGMAITAENLAERYEISRQEQDEYAYRSQMAYKAAFGSGKFKDEIVEVKIKSSKGETAVEADEHPRPDTTLEGLAALRPAFKKDGTVTAGNASGICDGASACIVADEDYARERGWDAKGRLLKWTVVGVDPAVMGIGPVPAILGLLTKSGLKLDDIGLIEINEAFAAQYLACEKALGLDRDRVNVKGGAISIGHPLAASGTRLTITLLNEMRERGVRYGIVSLCIGGGQGIAALYENPAI